MRNKKQNNQSGFTLIELLVVTAIMAIIATIGIVNWNTERSSRNLSIAQNETVTNIRKVQSYAISSRTAPSGPAKFYLMRFDINSSTYTTYSAGTDYVISAPIETVKMVGDVTISNIAVDYTTYGLSTNEPPTPKCVFVIFSATYGKTYFTSTDDSCDTNVVTSYLKSLPDLAPRANYNLTLTFNYRGTQRYARVYGFSGRVESYNDTPPLNEVRGTNSQQGNGAPTPN